MILPRQDIQQIIERLSNEWLELQGQRLFVTGGTGFVGTWLLESFIGAGQHFNLGSSAVVLTRSRAAFAAKCPHLASHPLLEVVEGDITDFEFPSGYFSHIIHAATETSHTLINHDPVQAFDKIASGMRRVSEFAAQAGARKILLTSSGAIYGVQPAEMNHVTETYAGGPDPLASLAVYAEGKRVAEMLGGLAARKYGFELKIARCFAFVGPNMPLDQHFAIGNFLRNALGDGPIVIQGDGTPFRSYLHAIDMAVWLWTILFRGRNCRPYNVGSDVATTLSECAKVLTTLLPGRREVVVRGASDLSRAITRYVPSIDRARIELGLSVSIPFQEALRRTLDALYANNLGSA